MLEADSFSSRPRGQRWIANKGIKFPLLRSGNVIPALQRAGTQDGLVPECLPLHHRGRGLRWYLGGGITQHRDGGLVLCTPKPPRMGLSRDRSVGQEPLGAPEPGQPWGRPHQLRAGEVLRCRGKGRALGLGMLRGGDGERWARGWGCEGRVGGSGSRIWASLLAGAWGGLALRL